MYFFGRMFVGPMKVIVKLICSTILGGVAILVINFIGGIFNFNIALNPVSAFMIGTLGIPGVGLIVALNSILNI